MLSPMMMMMMMMVIVFLGTTIHYSLRTSKILFFDGTQTMSFHGPTGHDRLQSWWSESIHFLRKTENITIEKKRTKERKKGANTLTAYFLRLELICSYEEFITITVL